MKKVKCILLVALLVLTLQNAANGDDSFLKIGVSGSTMSYLHSSDKTDFSWDKGNAGTPDKISQRNNSIPFGLIVEIMPVAMLRHTLIVRMTYNDYSFESTFFEHKLIRLDGETEDMMGYFSTVDQFDLSAICMDIQFKHYIVGDLNLATGVSIEHFTTNDIKRAYHVHEPDYHTFRPQEGHKLENNGRTKVLHDKSEIEEFNKLQFGVNLGIRYDFDISPIQVSPFVNFTYYLTSLISDQNLRFNKFNLGIDVMVKL
jgi:hypothetical protein